MKYLLAASIFFFLCVGISLSYGQQPPGKPFAPVYCFPDDFGEEGAKKHTLRHAQETCGTQKPVRISPWKIWNFFQERCGRGRSCDAYGDCGCESHPVICTKVSFQCAAAAER